MNLEQKTITSIEVAEMVGKEHKELLRDIRRYGEQLGQSKIAQSDFFAESTYRNSQNKEQPCYLVTKKGCEFIAHKLTGVKGTEFTAKYINRFHEMEDALDPYRGISPELAAVIAVDKRVTGMNARLDHIENDMPLFGAESDELSAHIRRRGTELLGGKKTEAYQDSTIRQRVYRDIYNQLRREFGIYDDEGRMKSYKALKRKDLADAHEFVDCYTLPAYLVEQINDCNAQMRMGGADGV
ncbi:Rha family transcriptional regulator [Clostridium fessum]|uniref:Rha family transcriptional regulator n=1 Tax=Clostridium fessum TaxID=2126740 RepID=UPI003AF02A3E